MFVMDTRKYDEPFPMSCRLHCVFGINRSSDSHACIHSIGVVQQLLVLSSTRCLLEEIPQQGGVH